MPERVILGLGSNLGDRAGHLAAAARRLAASDGIAVVAASSIYETAPLGVTDRQPDYLNQVLVLETDMPPEELLQVCQNLEQERGRTSSHRPLSPRTLDIDLIVYGASVTASPSLILPHPRYHQRRFVLLPLAQVQPDFRDPVTGRTIGELLDACEDHSSVVLQRTPEEQPC
ncbi:MAG: 2-amino-4-hydroxy-6-hydroxymethyldihydropteridine diphosphokinase [Candidatus Marinimicrobia bacterium]|nr:2-amino-4-hydroxy-6-hydroxymethyldihydropteridine diphosphokinase [Candidatus Neomarinimicrobiota bacterium]